MRQAGRRRESRMTRPRLISSLNLPVQSKLTNSRSQRSLQGLCSLFSAMRSSTAVISCLIFLPLSLELLLLGPTRQFQHVTAPLAVKQTIWPSPYGLARLLQQTETLHPVYTWHPIWKCTRNIQQLFCTTLSHTKNELKCVFLRGFLPLFSWAIQA